MKSSGQTIVVELQCESVTDPGEDVAVIANSALCPVDGWIKRVELNNRIKKAGTGSAAGYTCLGVGLSHIIGGSTPLEDTGLGSGGFEWVQDTEQLPTFNVGHGALASSVLYAEANGTREMRKVVECWRRVEAGQIIYLAYKQVGDPGDTSELDGYANVHITVGCKKKGHRGRPGNYRSAYEFGCFRLHGSMSNRWFWHAPSAGVLRNIEIMLVNTGTAVNCEFAMTKGQDLVSTHGFEPNVFYPEGIFISEHMEQHYIYRLWHPGFRLKQGDMIRFECEDTDVDTIITAYWSPKDGAPFRIQIPIQGFSTTQQYFENPMTFSLHQAILDVQIAASAARQGFLQLLGPLRGPDAAIGSGELEESIGIGGTVPESLDLADAGVSTNAMFMIPFDIPNGGHERYQKPLSLPGKVIRGGDVLATRASADLSTDCTAVLTMNGYIINKGRFQRTRTFTNANSTFFQDLSLGIGVQ